MSNQAEPTENQHRRKSEYAEILKILETRARKARLSIFYLIYTMMVVAVIVMGATYYLRSNQSPISGLTSSLFSLSEKVKTEAALKQFTDVVESLSKSVNSDPTHTAAKNNNNGLLFTASAVNSILSNDSPSEKIASSIASILLSFSVILFIGFVMKSILVFIRYYMQLGTDFDNQKIAFVLSKGNQPQFQQYLESLRDHNISFEKTPSLPQEKIITGLIEAIGNVKNKAKGDN